ncbi:MAG: hypothetical protein ABI336_01780 [Humibacillus sp.]
MSTYAAPLWSAALRRVAGDLRRDLDVARAGGASDAMLGEALRAAGPGFERFVARQRGSFAGKAGPMTHLQPEATLTVPAATSEGAASVPAGAVPEPVVDRWATHWARSVVALTTAGRLGPDSLARWVLDGLLPALRLDLATVTPLVLDDLVTAAAQVSGRADATAWARGMEAALAVWPSDVPLTDDRVREVGAVSAWRAGHVRLRAAARRHALSLPDAPARAALRVAPGQPVAALLERNSDTPCAWGDGTAPARHLGAFSGFGGAWLLPPVVLGGDGHRWTVVSGATLWTVLTDAFGVAVLPDDTAAADRSLALLPCENWWSRHGDDVTGAVSARGVCLVSRRSTHRLLLVPDVDAQAPNPADRDADRKSDPPQPDRWRGGA